MGKDKKKEQKKKEEKKVVVVEYSVSMHCNACERTVAKIFSKIKGVDTFMTDMPNNRVVVTGRIDPQKTWKKLRKKTGKRVEMSIKNDDKENEEEVAEKKITGQPVIVMDYCGENELLTMFNDENANACSVM